MPPVVHNKMETINNLQLKEVVRDFLLTPNPTHPLMIWGKRCTGKKEIIDEVVGEMKFYKLLKEEKYYSILDIYAVHFLKSLNITLNLFSDDDDEKLEHFEYEKRFSHCRIIHTNDSQNPHIIIAGKYTDEQQEQGIMQAINDRCNALAYLYVLTIDDWAKWAKQTGKANPYIVAFLKEHPEKFNYLDLTTPYSFPVRPYNWAQITSEISRNMEHDTFLTPNGYGAQTLYQILYKGVLYRACNAAPTFKTWLEEKFGAQLED